MGQSTGTDIELQPASHCHPAGDSRSRQVETNAVAGSILSRVSTQNEDHDVERSSCSPDTRAILEGSVETGDAEPSNWVSGRRLRTLGAALTLTNLMLAIDGSIIAAAIPRITSDFGSVNYIGWYGSAYLLTMMALQPLFGRVYKHFERKATYIVSLVIFEAGSILCATAPTSTALILGRSLAGCGAAGALMGSIHIFGQVIPLRQRPMGMSLVESITSLAGMVGSTVGGVITDSRLTWRFCFWINLPLGFIAAVMILLVLDREQPEGASLPILQKIRQLDIEGSILLSSSLVCLFLALEWGGVTEPWSSPLVWGCLLGFALLATGFCGFQWYKKDSAIIPLRIFKQRTIALCCIISLFYGFAIFADFYMLPIWFQGVLGTSAALSGINCLAFSLSSVISTLVCGFLTSQYGYPIPFMWVGSALYAVGSGLLFTLTPTSPAGEYLGYQVVAGIGMGLAVQTTFIAVQIVVPVRDMPLACGVEVFFRQLGGTIGVNVAQNLFVAKLTDGLNTVAPESLTQGIDMRSGIANLATLTEGLPPVEKMAIKNVINSAVARALLVPVVVASITAVASWGMEWLHIRDDSPQSTKRKGKAKGFWESLFS